MGSAGTSPSRSSNSIPGESLRHHANLRPKKPETSADRNLRICESILRDDPGDLRAAFYRAEGLRKLGRYREAGQAYMD